MLMKQKKFYEWLPAGLSVLSVPGSLTNWQLQVSSATSLLAG
jgi:hypothetical protein